MSTPAPAGKLYDPALVPAQDEESIRWLTLMDSHARTVGNQCWADLGVLGDSCQEDGPFKCRLGLCRRHCKEVH